jgi:hypothetical protein
MKRNLAWAPVIASVVAALAACSATADDADNGESDVVSGTKFFGDDRVGKALDGHPEKIPTNFQEYEKLFKVGRECSRSNSHEIFIVQEKQTRGQDANSTKFTGLLPRAVVTGCNTTGNNVKDSFSLMTATISDESIPKDEHRPDKGDVMSFSPLEVMAYDETTGLFNFYVFEKLRDGRASVTRFFRNEKAVTTARQMTGDGKTTADGPAKEDGKPTTRCFGCHVNGAPIMNESSNPWTNWISSASTQGKNIEALGGETLSIVREAIPHDGRSSLANELETIIHEGTLLYAQGSGKAANGWGNAVLTGKLPGGYQQVIKSVFCQTELNYLSSREVEPMQLFFDPSAIAAASLVEPPSVPGLLFPFLLPVRSEFDRATEQFVQSSGLLSDTTLLALRLVDDENDIFSPLRCGILDDADLKLPATLGSAKKDLNTVVSAYLLDKVTHGKFPWASSPDILPGGACDLTSDPSAIDNDKCAPTATRQYARAHYLQELALHHRSDRARAAYNAELATRFDAMKADFDGGHAQATAKDNARKKGAAKLFDCGSDSSCGPMPLMKP